MLALEERLRGYLYDYVIDSLVEGKSFTETLLALNKLSDEEVVLAHNDFLNGDY